MKRLRDERGAADPVLAEAARLLAARSPIVDDPLRRQRVRARLRRRRTAPRGAAWVRVAAVLLLVCSVAAASAMIGRVAQTIRARLQEARVARQHERERTHAHRPTPAAAPTPPTPALAPMPLTPPVPALAPTPPTPPTPALAPVSPTPPASPMSALATPTPTLPMPARVPAAPHAPARAIAAPAPARAHDPASPSIAPDDESEQARLVATAVRALRHEHDPARAAALLERYLERYPDGVAAEDALALALEATLGRDAPRAAGFATRYLAHYPQGRWSALAHRALAP